MRAVLLIPAAILALAPVPAEDPPRILNPFNEGKPPASVEQDARDVRSTVEGLHRAMQQFFSDRKVEPVMKYYEALIEYFSPAGERAGRDGVRSRLLAHAPHVKNFKTQVSPMNIRISGDMAWTTCEVHEQYTFDGEPGEEDLICTYVLEREPRGWKIVHEHQSIRMLDEGAARPPVPPPAKP